MSDPVQRPLAMPPVVNGAGSDGGLPDQKNLTLPPVIGNSSAGTGTPPDQRPLVLPPVI